VTRLLNAERTIQKNADQLLLFSSMVSLKIQDFGLWTQNNRQRLRALYLNLEHMLEQKYKPLYALWKQSLQDDGLGSIEAMPDVNLCLIQNVLIKVLFNDMPVPFKLTDVASIKLWWCFREYIQVDFKDESYIMDYASAATVLILLAFMASAAMDWTLHKDYFLNGAFGHCGGLVLAGGVTISLAAILFALLDICIKINLLQSMDSQLLLRAAREARFDESNKDASKQKGIVQLLTLLHQEIHNFDSRQALFGYPVTVAVRSTLCLSLTAALSSYVLEAVFPVLRQIDIHEIVTRTVMAT